MVENQSELELKETVEPEGSTVSAPTAGDGPLPATAIKPKLRAATGLLTFILFFGGQIFMSFAMTAIVIAAAVVDGATSMDQAVITELITAAMPKILAAAMVGGAIGLAVGARVVKKALRDNSAYGAAWSIGKPKTVILSIVFGIAVAIVYLILAALLSPTPQTDHVGIHAIMASQPGTAQLAWIVMTLLMAPFVEELLFRGILLGGLNRSFGIGWGVVMANLLFVLLHFSEAMHYWPAFIGIGLLAALATRQRLVTRAIGPSIAAHFGYNLIIVSAMVIASHHTV